MQYKWIAMVIVSIGIFMSTLDGSIVSVALPVMSEYFNTEVTTIEWVMTAYLLIVASLLLSLGRLSDIVGRKPVFFSGFLVFTLGSGLCAISVSEVELILFRILQGIGAAMIMATSPAIVTHVFPENERGRAFGLVGAVIAIGSMAGPILGGFLVERIGWRSVFYINLPVGIIGMLAIAYYLHGDENLKGHQKFDLKGAGILFISLVSLLLALSMGQGSGWGSLFISGMFASFILFLLIFLSIERKIKQPMVELNLFANRTFAAANLSAFISFVVMFVVIFLMPFFLKNVSNYSTAEVGLALVSIPLVMSLAAPVSGWLSDKTDSRVHSTVGMIITCIAIFLLSGLGADSGFAGISSRLGLLGLGLGLFQTPNNSTIMGSVPKERLGLASGTMLTMRTLGMVMGVAVAGAIFSSRFNLYTENAYVSAVQDTLIVAAIICLIGVMTSLAIKSGKKG